MHRILKKCTQCKSITSLKIANTKFNFKQSLVLGRKWELSYCSPEAPIHNRTVTFQSNMNTKYNHGFICNHGCITVELCWYLGPGRPGCGNQHYSTQTRTNHYPRARSSPPSSHHRRHHQRGLLQRRAVAGGAP